MVNKNETKVFLMIVVVIISVIQIMGMSPSHKTSADNNSPVDCQSGNNLVHYLCRVEWNPVNDLVAIESDYEILIWDTNLNKLISTLELGQPLLVMKWDASGKYLATGSPAMFLRIWDVNQAKLIDEIYLEPLFEEFDLNYVPYQIYSLNWSPDGKEIVIAHDGAVSLWDNQEKTISIVLPQDQSGPGGISHHAVSWLSLSKLLVVNSNGSVYVVDKLSHDIEQEIGIQTWSGIVNSVFNEQVVAFAGDRIAIVRNDLQSLDYKIQMLNLNSPDIALELVIPEIGVINVIDWNTEVNIIAIGSGDWRQNSTTDFAVRIFDMNTQSITQTIVLDDPVFSVSLNPDGTKVAFSTIDGLIHIENVQNLEQ